MAVYIPRRLLGILWRDIITMEIDPKKVRYHVRSARPGNVVIKAKFERQKTGNAFEKALYRQVLRITNSLESFIIDDACYEEVARFDDFPKYQKVKNFVENRKNYKESDWYLELLSSLKEKGFARHKNILMRSESDIDDFMLNYVLSLLDSLERDGFDRRKGGGLGRVLIGKDGSIHKCTSGRHRFYSSRILGIKPIPVRVAGVHEDWYREQVGAQLNPRKLREAISEVQNKYA